jgi:surfactin synthase thioesterase subunit
VTVSADAAWFVTLAHAGADRRLVCFPHAGAGPRMYRSWASYVPASVELSAAQIPGHERRIAEDPVRRLQPLVARLSEEVEDHSGRPFAFFGHSFGALVAFELARLLHEGTSLQPEVLFVSGCAAPHLPFRQRGIQDLTDEAFVSALREVAGVPEAILDHEEFLALLLPALRADMEMFDMYRYEAGVPLRCAISAFGGIDDGEVPIASIGAWRELTVGAFTSNFFPGGHFFVQSATADIVSTILTAWPGASGGARSTRSSRGCGPVPAP